MKDMKDMKVMKVYEILTLSEVLQKITDKTLPASISFKVLKLINFTNKEVEDFKAVMNQIAEKYGEKDAEDKFIPVKDSIGIKLKDETKKEAIKEMSSLYDSEVTIPSITFSLEELDKLELTIQELSVFMPFTTE